MNKCSYCGNSTNESVPCHYCSLGVCSNCGFNLNDLPVHVQCGVMFTTPPDVLTDERVEELSKKYMEGMKI